MPMKSQPDDSDLSPSARTRCWRAVDGLVIEMLDEGSWAVFHSQFWDSTVLGLIDHGLLKSLSESNAAVEEGLLVERVAHVFDLPCDEVFQTYCREALRQMAFVGLVREASKG